MSKYDFKVLKKVPLPNTIKKFKRISITILVVLFLFLFLPWQQTVEGEGIIIAKEPTQRPYAILSTIDGFIKKFYVYEDQFVSKGTLLFEMIDLDDEYLVKLHKIQTNIKEQIANTKADILLGKQKLENLEKSFEIGLTLYDQKLSQTEDKIKTLTLNRVSLEKNHAIAKLNYERIKKLYEEGIESKRSFEISENKEIETNAKVEKNRVEMEIEHRNIAMNKNEKEKFTNDTKNSLNSLQGAILASQNRLSALEQSAQTQSMSISRYNTSKVYAPTDGHVVRVYENNTNKLIKKGKKVLYFAPDMDEKLILFKVSDFNMPLIQKGLKVRLMFYGWPSLQVAGWPKITFGTFAGIIKKIDPVAHEEGVYYAYISQDPEDEPWPQDYVLRPGTKATGWVRLHTVPIWYQIWRLMNAMPPQLKTVPEVKK